MIKSLEIIIAIMILFAFLFFMFQNAPEKTIPASIGERVYDLLKLKADDPSFRTLVLDGNANKIYDSLYDYMDVSYGVSVCNGVSRDCTTYNISNDTTRTTNIDYYFYDSNKIVGIKAWVE